MERKSPKMERTILKRKHSKDSAKVSTEDSVIFP